MLKLLPILFFTGGQRSHEYFNGELQPYCVFQVEQNVNSHMHCNLSIEAKLSHDSLDSTKISGFKLWYFVVLYSDFASSMQPKNTVVIHERSVPNASKKAREFGLYEIKCFSKG